MLPALFNTSVFQAGTMIAKINTIPMAPRRISSMGLFKETPIATTTIQVDSDNAILTLIGDTPRGAPAPQLKKRKGASRDFRVSRFPVQFQIKPDDMQNIRALGTADQLRTLEMMRDQRFSDASNSLDATLEYQRLGAVKGIILDADGATVKYNLFTEFGVAQPTKDFTLGTAAAEMLPFCYAVKRGVDIALGDGVLYDHIHVLCGKTWFERFTTHPAVSQYYKNWQAAEIMRTDNRGGFKFGGMIFEEYPVNNVNGIALIADSEAYAFPVGVQDLFETVFAPANHMDYVNQLGLPRYVFAELMDMGSGIDFVAETNPLSICKKPLVLWKLTTSN